MNTSWLSYFPSVDPFGVKRRANYYLFVGDLSKDTGALFISTSPFKEFSGGRSRDYFDRTMEVFDDELPDDFGVRALADSVEEYTVVDDEDNE